MKEAILHIKSKKTLSRLLPFLAVLFFWMVFSSPYLFKGLVPFPSTYLADFFPPWSYEYGMPVKNNAMPDIISQIYPWKKLVIESIRSGSIPKWNPYQFSGTPLLANYQSASFSPLNILFLLLPFIHAWSISILLQMLLSGLFMLLFVRGLHIGRAGSVVSAVSFMFCGFIVVWGAYGTLAFAILYLPLFLYSIENWFEKKKLRYLLVSTLVIPLSFFSGHFQTSLYFLATGFFYAVYKTIIKKDMHSFFSSFISICVGLCLSLPQIIPTLQLFYLSVRSDIFTITEAIPWNYFPTIIAPDFYGNPVTRNDWYGHYAEWASFTGSITFILALIGVFFARKKHNAVLFFILLACMSLLLAFKTPLTQIIVSLKIPILSTTAISRIIVLFSFSVAVLAGFGTDTLTYLWSSSRLIKKVVVFTCIYLIALACLWILLLSHNSLFIIGSNNEMFSIAKRNLLLPSILTILFFGLLFLGYLRNNFLRKLILISICILVSLDLLRFSSKWMPFESQKYVYPEAGVVTFLQKNASFNRVFGNIGNEVHGYFGLQGIEGYDPLYIKRYGEFIQSAGSGSPEQAQRSVVQLNKNGLYTKKILDLLGVRFIVHAKADGRNIWAFPYWDYPDSFSDTPVYSDTYYEIYENKNAFPRAFLVHEVIIENNEQEIIKRMFSQEIDLSKTVVLEQKPDYEIAECAQDQILKDSVVIKTYEANKIILDVFSECGGFIVLTDNHYPIWKAYVNGELTSIHRADYSFRSVFIPKGTSRVEFLTHAK
jgi:hypothetical protein